MGRCLGCLDCCAGGRCGGRFKGALWRRAAAALLLLLTAAGCTGARSEEPSFFERMLSGEADEGRSIAPELWLVCSTPEAEVMLDGTLQGLCSDFTDKGMPLGPGPHEVLIRHPGFLPYEATVETGRARMTLNVDLVRMR